MEGMTEQQLRNFLRMQEVCPNEDPSDLYHVAAPHLKKSDRDFNIFLNDFMQKKFQNDSEGEEDREIRASLTAAFTKHVQNEEFTLKPSRKSISNKKQYDSMNSQKNPAPVSLWDNMESIQNEQLEKMEVELDRILDERIEDPYEDGRKIRNVEPKSNEKEETTDTIESDSDESFHSVEGEPGNKNISPDKTKNLYNRMEKVADLRRQQTLSMKCYDSHGNFSEEMVEAIFEGKKDIGSDKSMLNEAAANEISDQAYQPKHEMENERKSFCEEKGQKKSFVSFNGMILQKKDETSEKPMEVLEKKKDIPSAPLEIPKQTHSQADLIDFFFSQNPKNKENPVNKNTDYQKMGAIPKNKNLSKPNNGFGLFRNEMAETFSEPRGSTAAFNRNETLVPDLPRNSFNGITPGNGKKEPDMSEKFQNGDRERKSETKVPEIKNLDIPSFPFVYVVSDSYSPNFRLPKGNYLISNRLENAETGLKVLYHPKNVEERNVEISGKKSEPEPAHKNKFVCFSLNPNVAPFEYTPATSSQLSDKSYAQVTSSKPNEFHQLPLQSQRVEPSNMNWHKGRGKSNSELPMSLVGGMQRLTLEQPKIEPLKAPLKGKIFCNTPVNSLKKDSEDRNESADAYGAILQSLADEFKSSKKDAEPKRTPTPKSVFLGEDHGSNVLLNALMEKPASSKSPKEAKNGDFPEAVDRFGFGKFKIPVEEKSEEKEEDLVSDKDSEDDCGDDEENEGETEDEEQNFDGEDDRVLSLLALLKKEDPDYVREKLEKCGDDVELQKQVIEKEVERSLQTEMESQKINAGYVRILKELPQLDPEYVLNKWSDMAGDDSAIDAFIQTEKLKFQLREIKDRLYSNLPLLNREFLEGKASDFLHDPEGLEVFIDVEKKKMIVDQQYQNMMNRLPGADPILLREKVEEFEGDELLVEEFIEAEEEKLRKQEERNNQIINMHLILPDADPAFLAEQFEKFSGNETEFNNLLFGLLESKNYPKIKKDDPAFRERSELWKRFVDNFDIKDFISKIPNPEEHFSGSKGDDNKTSVGFINKFLQSRYPEATIQDLEKTYRDRRFNLTNTCSQLDFQMKPVEIMDVSFRNENIPESFLLEMVYILHRREIRDYLREKKEFRNLKVAEARKKNALLNCACCFEDELLEEDVSTCADGHVFCIDCVTRSVETKLSDSDTKFSCLTANCSTEFTLAILERVLPRNLYSKVLKKKQAAEVTEAKVPGLESCPSCDFAYIPSQEDKIFKCENPDCLRETCRKCKDENHLPKRCEEIERPKDTLVRKEIEEKMTEALVRACPKCGKKFVKSDGCNKMTCVCGATSCYLCRKLVNDYSHFNGQGGSNFHLCPLFSNNDDLHVGQVRRVGQQAVNQALLENPDLHLVYDPTKTL